MNFLRISQRIFDQKLGNFINVCELNKNLETVVLNIIPTKWWTMIFKVSQFISLTLENCKKLRSDSFTEMFKSACLMSLKRATLYERNLIKISINFVVSWVQFLVIDLKILP